MGGQIWTYFGQTYAIDKNVLFKYMGANFTDFPINGFIPS